LIRQHEELESGRGETIERLLDFCFELERPVFVGEVGLPSR
jgi:hypothetical protein